MYKKASKLKLRFDSKFGTITTEQLWDLSLKDLDTIAIDLDNKYNESGKKSFLKEESVKDVRLKLMFDIVVDVLTDKKKAMETASKAKETKAFNEKILAKISEAQESELDNLSVDELKAMLKS